MLMFGSSEPGQWNRIGSIATRPRIDRGKPVMTRLFVWVIAVVLNPPQEAEMSERLAPPGWQGNYWGPAATKARHDGTTPPIVVTPHMAKWDRWGRKILRDGDIVFRRGDARLAHGYF